MSVFRPYLTGAGERGRKRDLGIAAGVAAVAALLLALPRPFQDGIARTIRGTVLRPAFAIQQSTVDREGRFDDPARLRAERDSLAVYLVGQANLAAENRQLRAMLGLRERLPYTFVPAEVQRLGGVTRGAFRLAAGSRLGVQPGAAVIAAGGLVGSVRDADANTSMGIDWTHTDFRASAMTTDGETYGIVEPRTLRSGEPMLALTGTASHTALSPGTLIVTSGQGGVYPRGIPIGRVVQASEEEQAADWRRSYLIRPLVSPAAMDYVLILGPLAPGRGESDLAAAWGVRAEALKERPAPVAIQALPPATFQGSTAASPQAQPQPQPQPQQAAAPPPSSPQPGTGVAAAAPGPTQTPAAQAQRPVQTQPARPAARPVPPPVRTTPQTRPPVPLLGTPVAPAPADSPADTTGARRD